MRAKIGLYSLPAYYNPFRPGIVPVISAICFRDFTSEKWWKSGNYARFFVNYARNPRPDDASGTRSGSCHRRRDLIFLTRADAGSLRPSHGLHRKQWYGLHLPLEPFGNVFSDDRNFFEPRNFAMEDVHRIFYPEFFSCRNFFWPNIFRPVFLRRREEESPDLIPSNSTGLKKIISTKCKTGFRWRWIALLSGTFLCKARMILFLHIAHK